METRLPLKELQQVKLNILQEFNNFCEEHKPVYYLN